LTDSLKNRLVMIHSEDLEARVGIEPTHKGLADPEELAANLFAFRRSAHVRVSLVRLECDI
jgi:hypothetical protein